MTHSEISDKAAFVREALSALEAVPQSSRDEFLADPRTLPATLHWLQTAIQGLLDIGLVLVGERGLAAPRTSLEVLERLEGAGALPAGTATRYRPLIGFRNRVVHLYDRIDPDIVYAIVTRNRDDLRTLLGLLLPTT